MVTAALYFMWACILAAVGMVAWSLRPRQVDVHPRCRACGYDLTGLPETSDACPECGADIGAAGAIVVGRRERRWGAVLAAALPGIAAYAGVVGLEAYQRSVHDRPQKLVRAIEQGDSATVRAMIHRWPYLLRLPGGWGGYRPDPFIRALLARDIPLLSALFEALPELDINAQLPDGRALLHVVAARGDGEMVGFLLKNGARPDEPDIQGVTAGRRAVEAWSERTLAVLLDHGADPNRANAPIGDTLLHTSVRMQVPRNMLQRIIDAGADVNRPDSLGRTPLHEAILARNEMAAKVLIAAGADFAAVDRYGLRPSQTRWAPGQRWVARLWHDLIHAAVGAGDYPRVEALLTAEPKAVGFVDVLHGQLLHWAAQQGDEKLAGILLQHGAAVNGLDYHGATPGDRRYSWKARYSGLSSGSRGGSDLEERSRANSAGAGAAWRPYRPTQGRDSD